MYIYIHTYTYLYMYTYIYLSSPPSFKSKRPSLPPSFKKVTTCMYIYISIFLLFSLPTPIFSLSLSPIPFFSCFRRQASSALQAATTAESISIENDSVSTRLLLPYPPFLVPLSFHVSPPVSLLFALHSLLSGILHSKNCKAFLPSTCMA